MRTVIVTGASSGLGREFAKQIPRCYRNLDEIWLIARSSDKLEKLKEELTGDTGIYCRIYDSDLLRDYVYFHLQRDLESLKPEIRMLVNAAGMGSNCPVSRTDIRTLTDMISLNCGALTHLTSLCLPYMSSGSRIVNLASAAAFAPQPGSAVYAATKAYVLSYSRALGCELAERHIFVTAVCPGPVDTEFFRTAGEPAGRARKKLMAQPDKVVKKALSDVRRRRSLSIYGTAMKGAKAAAKLAPDRLTDWFMNRMNTRSLTKDEN